MCTKADIFSLILYYKYVKILLLYFLKYLVIVLLDVLFKSFSVVTLSNFPNVIYVKIKM